MKLKVLVAVLIVAGLGGYGWLEWPEPGYRMVMCDVGQGDAILINHGFSQFLVDTGPDQRGVLACLGKYMPFWDRELETVLITHRDNDHIGGLMGLMQRYHISHVLLSPDTYRSLSPTILNRLHTTVISKNDHISWEKTVGEVLWPPASTKAALKPIDEPNDDSVVWRWNAGAVTVWFAGDAEGEIEEKLMEDGLVKQSTILKVAHHGSKNATKEAFLAILQPYQAWISVGANNRYHHPQQELLQRLGLAEIPVRRTDKEGSIQLRLSETGEIMR